MEPPCRIEDQNVDVYDAAGNYVTYAFSDASGTYVSEDGLPAGTYYARTWNSLGMIDELWDNITCLECDVTTGTPIAVTVGTTTPGIDFALAQGGLIAGTVTHAGTGDPLVFANVHPPEATVLLAGLAGSAASAWVYAWLVRLVRRKTEAQPD